ncbi:hypothetical protein GOP47_0007162 [Adiantum capillus-veneris]|uniref:Mitochondrial import inner membrane translocase subunit TIM50 n=1 Tax=Adiantum capillus-veneris TaxID=13818 RepID=A0A9D4V0D2_ADICA|nr:hypothetical protein GOP47_0007162 [Adiantum capillus-veneris]
MYSSTPLLPAQSPQNHGRPTLILDLDNTLMSVRKGYTSPPLQAPSEFSFLGTGDNWWTAIKRPGIDDFLHEMATLYEIVVFTSGAPRYATNAVSHLDKSGCIAHTLCNVDCDEYFDPKEGKYVRVKDLTRLRRDLSRVVAVDDDPLYYSTCPLNAIGISYFTGDSSDQELEKLTPLLRSLAQEEDIPLALLKRRKELKEAQGHEGIKL